MKIVLVGYMASGKSSLGILLADSLGIDFIDLDKAIENQERKTIPEIFSKRGELYFRKKEGEVLNSILDKDSFVLSTGGGTPCYGRNMEHILVKSTHCIYLKLSIPSLVDRIANELENRPLVKHLSKEELPEFIGKHLFERSFFYNKAGLQINCDGKTIDEVLTEIRELL